MSLRGVTTVSEGVVTRRSRWYTEGAWAHLLYLTPSHTSIYVENRERRRTIRTHPHLSIRTHPHLSIRAKSSNDCDRTPILTIHSTSTWHKPNQEKERIIQYNHTLPSHRVRLSSIIYFSAQWMAIIEQENTALRTLQPRTQRVQRKRLSSSDRGSDRNIVCKRYRHNEEQGKDDAA